MSYYDRAGNPITMDTWIDTYRTPADKRVALTTVGEVNVSTVWLGIDYRFGDGPPLIFETMVFGGPLDQECDRYSTEEQARAGHEAMVARVRAAHLESDNGAS